MSTAGFEVNNKKNTPVDSCFVSSGTQRSPYPAHHHTSAQPKSPKVRSGDGDRSRSFASALHRQCPLVEEHQLGSRTPSSV